MLVKRFFFFIWKQMSFEVNASGEGVPSPESPSGLGQVFFQLLRANWRTPLQGLPLPEAGCLAQLFTEWSVQEYKGSPPVSTSLEVIPAPGLPIRLVEAFQRSCLTVWLLLLSRSAALIPYRSFLRVLSTTYPWHTNLSVFSREPDLRYFNLERREIYWARFQVSTWNLECL